MNAIIINQPNEVATINEGLNIDLLNTVITNKAMAGQLADILLQGVDMEKTKLTYRQAITSFILFLGGHGLPLRKVARVHIRQFKDHLLTVGNTWGAYEHKIKPLSKVSTNKYLASVKFALDELVGNDEISGKTVANFKKIKSKTDKGKPMTGQYIPMAERQAISQALNELTTNDSYKAMLKAIFALLQLGLRREEIANLNVDSLRNGELTVMGKGGKTRVILLASAKFTPLRNDIMAWCDRLIGADMEAGKPLFFKVNTSRAIQYGERTDGQAIYHIIKKFMPTYSPHDFRRTMISDLLNAGVDFSTICKISGHESTEMIKRYDRRDNETIQDAMNKLTLF